MKRRGFIVLLVLAMTAVVLTIVFINLFKEKSTKALADSVHTAVESGYLNPDSDEYETINEYLQKVYSVLSSSVEKAEVKNYQDAYAAFCITGDFFDRQIVFSEFTTTYKNQRKAIQSNLKKGQASADKLEAVIIETKELIGQSSYWQANTWANFKTHMNDVYKYTTNAFVRLEKVYKTSIPSKIMNNDLTTLIFGTFENLTTTFTEKVSEDANCGQKIYNFVNLYLAKNKETIILNFNYNEIAQENVRLINEKGAGWEIKYNAFLQGNIAVSV